MNDEQQLSGQKYHRKRRALAGLGLITFFCALMLWLAATPPKWFQPVTPNALMETRSGEFEQGLAAQFTKVRGADRVWAIRILESDMNEWLASRLPKWMEYERKDSTKKFGSVQVKCDADHLFIASQLAVGVGVVQITPNMVKASSGTTESNSVNKMGDFYFQAQGAALGHLPVPAFLISAFVPTDLFESLKNSEFRLADGRHVRVTDVEILPGEIRLELNTSPTSN